MNVIDLEGNPLCQPLMNLKDLFNWSASSHSFYKEPDQKKNEWNKFQPRSEDRPQVIVCHDMKGGYLEDRFIQGSDNPSAYRFYHWHLIDTFIYFSHHFITIPPAGWIQAAHRNGVRILGTIITESKDGEEICKDLLASKNTIDRVVNNLVEIALAAGFDGWFINIENPIEEKSLQNLQYFVQQMTQQCHGRLENAKVFWYDSVTCSGDLQWQDQLNHKNEMFFSVCDGIFLNYCITDEKLANSRDNALCLNRCFDVYAGVDIFGRGSPGGGGFGCIEAVKMISKQGLSYAFFAPGWVYEVLGEEEFHVHENKFWRLIKDFLPIRPVEIPFKTSFCQGFGEKHSLSGKVIGETPWHNLCLQQLQPCCYDNTMATYTTLDAYNGGGCLKIVPGAVEDGLSTIRLFKILLQQKEMLHLSSVWKDVQPEDNPSCFAFMLVLEGEMRVSSPRVIVCTRGESATMNKDAIALLLNRRGGSETLCKESLHLIHGCNLMETGDNDWRISQWDVDTSMLTAGSADTLEVSLYAVLAPSTQSTCAETGLLLGLLQMESKSSKKLIGIVNDTYIMESTLTVPENLCKTVSDVEQLQKLFISDSIHTEDYKVVNKSLSGPESSCSVKVCSVICQEMEPFMLHFLQWNSLNPHGDVDYYVVLSQDDAGSTQFVCCSRFNTFVEKYKSDKSRLGLAYHIQAVRNVIALH